MTKEFGELCRGYRFALGIKQEEGAERVGINSSYLRRIERGEQESGKETTKRLLKGLQVPLERQAEFLLYGAGFPPERVEELLIQSTQEINITRNLKEGETLEIEITTDSVKLKKHPAPTENP